MLRKDAKKGGRAVPKEADRRGDQPGLAIAGLARSEAARRLAELIEVERRSLGEIPDGGFASPEVVRRLQRLEGLINEYMRLVRDE